MLGIPELRRAMADWYKRWYNVDLDPATEIQPLIGSKEGILHVTLALVNPGDQVLVPNPGYPTYTSLNRILGSEIVTYDLQEAGEQPLATRFRTTGTDGPEPGKNHVDQLSEHADRCQRYFGTVPTAGRLRTPAQHCHRQR